jgi:hypothetical protein
MKMKNLKSLLSNREYHYVSNTLKSQLENRLQQAFVRIDNSFRLFDIFSELLSWQKYE